MRRRARPILAGLLAAAAIAVWAWRLATPRPAPPQLPENLQQLDREVAASIRQAVADVGRDRGDAIRWFELGALYEAHELFQPARECYQQALALRDTEARWWYRLALMCEVLGDLDGAIDAMQRAGERSDSYAPIHWRLSLWLLDRGEAAAAYDAASRAVGLDPADATARLALARVQLQRGEHEDAVALLEALARVPNPNAGYANRLLGQAYLRLGRREDAEAALERGQSGEAQWVDPWQELETSGQGFGAQMDRALALVGRRRINEAIALLEQLRDQKPHDANLLNNLAIVYRMNGRLDDSVRVLEGTLSRHPDFYPAHLSLAIAHLVRSDQRPAAADPLLEQASLHLDRALATNPSYAPAHGVKGDLMVKRGRHEAAIASYLEAARCEPDNPGWLYRAAGVQAKMSRWQDVVATLEPLTERAPHFGEAFFELGRAHAMLGRQQQARAALQRAAELRPGDPRVTEALRRLRPVQTPTRALDGPAPRK